LINEVGFKGKLPMTNRTLIAREEVLGGMAGRTVKQAHTVIALIENRTAHLTQQARQAGSVALTVAALQTPRQHFLAALAEGRTQTLPPTIQEVERFAAAWADLIPQNPEIRAAVAQILQQRCSFTASDTPGIQQALGLNTPAVQEAYQRLYGTPLAQNYQTTAPPLARLQWGWAGVSRRLEQMPPFWLAFLLTMPGAAGLLALPIALAQVGTVWGLALVLSFGLINLLTATALAETVVRSGTARFGLGFLGQLAQEYLGKEASLLLTVVLAANNFLVLIIFFLGVAGTLGGGAPIATVLWLIPFAAVVISVLSRRSLNTTIATTVIIVLVNLTILLLIPLLALPYVQPQNLITGGSSAASFTPAALGSIVGVLSSTFLSHFVVATYGPVVLSREPSGRAWVRGSAGALLVYILIACLWLLVINGVLAPATLRQSNSAVVIPLAAVAGSAIYLLGSLLMVLSVGLTALQVALGLYYLVEERLPRRGAAAWFGQLGETPRFILAITPILVALAVTVWLALSGTGSFTSLLGVVSVFTLPLVTGILPLLLLVATRRKGDFPAGFVVAWLGHPIVVGLLYLFFVASVLLHGLYIWESLPLRVAAILGGMVMIALAFRIWQQGLLTGRTVITVRQDERVAGRNTVEIMHNGQPLPTAIQQHYDDHTVQTTTANAPIHDMETLRTVRVTLPAAAPTQLKVWLHHLTPEGASRGLPANVVVANGAPGEQIGLSVENGQVLLPPATVSGVEIQFDAPAGMTG
jgi:amino acid permease